MPSSTSGKVVFISHPLRGDIASNLKSALTWVRWAVKQRVNPVMPWFTLVHAFDDTDPNERLLGMDISMSILLRCDELWVCGERISEGMQAEIDRALRWNIPVKYFKEQT